MLKIFLAALPIAMFAQSQANLAKPHSHLSKQVFAQVANADTSLSIQTAAQIAQIASSMVKSCALKDQNFYNAKQLATINTQIINSAKAISELTSTMTAKSLAKPVYAKQLNSLKNHVKALSRQTASRTSDQQIMQTAYKVSQVAAKIAQEMAFAKPGSFNETIAKAAIQSSYAAGLTLKTASLNQLSSNATNPTFDSKQAQSIVRANSSEIFSKNNQLVLGNPYGDITIVEFNDYNCTYCKQMSATLDQAAKSDPNLRIMIKEVPLVSPESTIAAKAVIAAKRQGQYANFRSMLTASNSPTTPMLIANIAKSLHLNQAEFQSDINNPAADSYLARNIALANSLGLEATPTLIISKNDGMYSEVITGTISLNQLQTLVAAVRSVS